jgi:hypothetical protein
MYVCLYVCMASYIPQKQNGHNPKSLKLIPSMAPQGEALDGDVVS